MDGRKRVEKELEARVRQQAAVSQLGLRALSGIDLLTLMNEAVALVAEVLEVDYSKVLELLPGGDALVLRAGVGWRDGYVGHATVGAEVASQAGYTLLSREPVITQDLRTEKRFTGPALLAEHDVVSGMSVIIHGEQGPFGVLGAHTTKRRTFTEQDVHFLQAVANVLASAIERKRAEETLRESEERFRTLYTRTPVMLHSIDARGRLVAVSDHWLEVLGYQRDEVIGRKSVEFLTEESKRYAETVALPEFWKTSRARDIPYQFVKKNGETIDVLLSAIGEPDADGKICRTLAVLIDVTERKRLGEALQRAREELEGKVERQMLRRNPYGLTFREFTVLHHVAAGKADKEIARELGISPLTASKHVANILGKMNATSRTDAGVRAVREGLLD